MLHSLVVGLGRAGSGLHLRVLAQARERDRDLFHSGAIIACDHAPEARRALTGAGESENGVTVAESVRAAAELVPPARTVVHLCTPPEDRPGLLGELAQLGFHRVIVEKPLAVDTDGLAEIIRLRERYGLRLAVVAQWLDAELTRRLGALIEQRTLGELRSISFRQHKPRFTHSMATGGHPTAFDVEIPHSLGVALRLAGPAELLDASWTDMCCDAIVLPRMGGARLALRHHGGVHTAIVSDLTAPVRERRITLEFERGSAIGHFPLSEHDHHAQLRVHGADDQWSVFPDNALTEFVLRTYRRFRDLDSQPDDVFGLHCGVIRLLSAAKRHCRDDPGSFPTLRRTSFHAG